MTTDKDLKRLVRARMKKTGEAYTAARAQVVRKPKTAETSDGTTALRATTKPSPKDFAALAGTSDEVIEAKTGCTWERWVAALDYLAADKLSHREIAALIKEKYDTPSWWTQTVAVGYERIKGLRAIGQQRDGSYGMNRSRTYTVDVATLFDAWADTRTRKRWLGGEVTKVRTSTAPKTMRLQMSDGAIVAVGFSPKGKDKSSVAIEQARLPDKESAERLKQLWSARLDALGEELSK